MMSVDAEIHKFTGPNFCHINITRKVPTSLARLVGVTYLPVSVTSSAGAYLTNKAVMPNWLTNMAVSYRIKNNILDIDTNDKENNNGWFISEWRGTDNPIVRFGVTNVSAGTGSLAGLADGILYNVAIVNGGKPEEKNAHPQHGNRLDGNHRQKARRAKQGDHHVCARQYHQSPAWSRPDFG